MSPDAGATSPDLPDEVRTGFRDRLMRDRDRLGALRDAFAAGAPDAAWRDEATVIAHRLLGAGATFGAAAVSAAADDLERLLGLSGALTGAHAEAWRRLVAAAFDRLARTIDLA